MKKNTGMEVRIISVADGYSIRLVWDDVSADSPRSFTREQAIEKAKHIAEQFHLRVIDGDTNAVLYDFGI